MRGVGGDLAAGYSGVGVVLLTHKKAYVQKGLNRRSLERLSLYGDLLLRPGPNVTGIHDSDGIERLHFLDCLSLLDLPPVRLARSVVDVGSGAGLPALVVALALPGTQVVAVESVGKKCRFIEEAAMLMELGNVTVRCARVEEYARQAGRSVHDVAVSRALASLPVVAEYSLPLLALGGVMVAMKGEISTQERIQSQKALDILGGGELESVRLEPFPEAENRWIYMAEKVSGTPSSFPRRPGLASQRPLGR